MPNKVSRQGSRWRMRYLAAFFFLWLVSCSSPCEAAQVKGEYLLPEKNDANIIIFSLSNNMVSPGRSGADLIIQADGTLAAGNATDSLSHQELQALLSFIIDDNGFFSINSMELQEKINIQENMKKELFTMVDGSVSSFWLQIEGKEHQVLCANLSTAAKRYPEIARLANLNAIQRRLLHLKNVAQAGGRKQVAQYLESANKKLLLQYPQARPFTNADLEFADQLPSGNKQLRFFRRNACPPDQNASFCAVSILVKKDASTDTQVTCQE